MNNIYTAISLFSGAGGMDVGFKDAGVSIVWANELDKNASDTYEANHPEIILRRGDINESLHELHNYKGTDIIFGGPPCQGFSVAGKMDPDDERSKLIWTYLDVVKIIQPKAFVLENVKALGTLAKWKEVRDEFLKVANNLGYICYPIVLNSSDFGVPQKRERVFFIALKKDTFNYENIIQKINSHRKPSKSIRKTISHLGPAGTENNPLTCTSKITFASKPVMRKSPYAGMMFNGAGRPLNLDGVSNTLPASMGGNKTPIIDEEFLFNPNANNWILNYHKDLVEGNIQPRFGEAPSRLRRLTINEAALIQSFPENYIFRGSKSSIYRQIGNAVPCLLAEVVAKAVIKELDEI
ncbi:DNA cytosine methyltransferase [Tissierella sp. MSJ-40]|uniref:DNA cytosine methyltransferase n=1 Tax=Tissierella simiarum TaxID=2841534 RepID=A0ABS6EC61_9FIRM|nr:DNA cytosine methyltransferase [Tissierella simiarum]